MARRAGSKRAEKSKERRGPQHRESGTKNSKRSSVKGANASSGDFLDPRLIQAIAHPMRVNILALASWRVISPSEFARETGEPLNQVSYHFRRLVEYGTLELVGTQNVRGTVKHLYRGTQRAIFAGSGWEELPKSVQDGVAGAALQDFMKVAVLAFENGTFSAREDSHLTWEALTYDELAFKAMVRILARTREQLSALQDEAGLRLSKTGQAGILVAVALSGFEMAEP